MPHPSSDDSKLRITAYEFEPKILGFTNDPGTNAIHLPRLPAIARMLWMHMAVRQSSSERLVFSLQDAGNCVTDAGDRRRKDYCGHRGMRLTRRLVDAALELEGIEHESCGAWLYACDKVL